MTLPSWLQTEDGERYVEDHEAEVCPACAGYGEVVVDRVRTAPWMETTVECGLCDTAGYLHAETREPLVPARCCSCERPVPHDALRPLCARCDQAYAAHGRTDAERTRQERAGLAG